MKLSTMVHFLMQSTNRKSTQRALTKSHNKSLCKCSTKKSLECILPTFGVVDVEKSSNTNTLNSHRAIKYPAPNSEKDKIGYVYSKTIGSREHSYVKHCGKLIHQKEINVDLSHKSKNENFSTISSKFHSCGPSHHYNTNQVNRNFQTSLYKFKYRKRHSNRSISVIKDGDNKTIYCDKHSSDLVMNEKLTKPRNQLKSISQINRKQREYNKENSKRSYLNNYLIPKEKLNMNNKNLKATLTHFNNLIVKNKPIQSKRISKYDLSSIDIYKNGSNNMCTERHIYEERKFFMNKENSRKCLRYAMKPLNKIQVSLNIDNNLPSISNMKSQLNVQSKENINLIPKVKCDIRWVSNLKLIVKDCCFVFNSAI